MAVGFYTLEPREGWQHVVRLVAEAAASEATSLHLEWELLDPSVPPEVTKVLAEGETTSTRRRNARLKVVRLSPSDPHDLETFSSALAWVRAASVWRGRHQIFLSGRHGAVLMADANLYRAACDRLSANGFLPADWLNPAGEGEVEVLLRGHGQRERSRWAIGVSGIASGLLAWCGVGLTLAVLLEEEQLQTAWVWLVALAPVAAASFMILYSRSQLVVGHDGLTIRNPFRSYHVPLDAVVAIEERNLGGFRGYGVVLRQAEGLPSRIPIVASRDSAAAIRLLGVAPFRL